MASGRTGQTNGQNVPNNVAQVLKKKSDSATTQAHSLVAKIVTVIVWNLKIA